MHNHESLSLIDYLSTWISVIIVLIVLVLSVKLLINPKKYDKRDIKRVVIEGQRLAREYHFALFQVGVIENPIINVHAKNSLALVTKVKQVCFSAAGPKVQDH